MIAVARAIESTVEQHAQFMRELSVEAWSAKKPGKWSAKEILGHLIDSAQNNIQRFVRGQYEGTPKIVYAQDVWVRLQGYQQSEGRELITLWVSLNRQLCRILLTMDPAHYENTVDTGEGKQELHTLAFLADDYQRHLIHHLNQLRDRIKTTL